MTRAAAVLAAWRSLPLAGLDRISGGRPLLVLAPHPDDESLGCGGLIAESCARGGTVHVVILTDGTRSPPNSKTHPAARTGARPLSYPVWGWTLPDEHELPDTAVRGVRLDIAPHLEAKRRAIAAHASQLGESITDDPAGAVLPARLLADCTQPYEVFF